MDPKIIPPKALACGPGRPPETAAGNCSITLIQVFCIWTIITNIIIINKYVFLINYKTQIMTLMKVICLTECVIGLVMWTGLDFASELYPNTGICNSNSKFGKSNSESVAESKIRIRVLGFGFWLHQIWPRFKEGQWRKIVWRGPVKIIRLVWSGLVSGRWKRPLVN